jgi:hypothetical protein
MNTLTVDPTKVYSRNFLNEGTQSTSDLSSVLPSVFSQYGGYTGAARPGGYAGGMTEDDLTRYLSTISGGQFGQANAGLTDIAAQQTAAANSALRAGNLADAQKYAQQALDLRKQSNPELYAGLSQYQTAAGNQVTSDLARLQQAQTGQLSAEDARNAQQAAREAYAARGLVMGKGAIGAEIMNRDALSRQRQNEARTNLSTSMGQLYQGIGAQTANVFDPTAATLGQQYGMQSGNVGMNTNLSNQAGALTSGGMSNQYIQGMINPYNPYATDVYNTNVNAANAGSISAATNAANLKMAEMGVGSANNTANTNMALGLLGGLYNYGKGAGWFNPSTPSTGTGKP